MKTSFKILSLILVAIMVLTVILPSVSPVSASSGGLSPKDNMFYQKLYKGQTKSFSAKYPVNVNITGPNKIDLNFKGYAGVDAKLSEQEIVDVLKSAVPVGKYKTLDEVADDYDLLERVKYELSTKKEDVEEFKNDMKELLGIKGISDILQDCLILSPSTLNGFNSKNPVDQLQAFNGLVDAGMEIYDAAHGAGRIFKKPSLVPSAGDIAINGTKLMIKQYEKDQKKWNNRVTYYNTKRDLQQFYSNLENRMREAIAKKSVWTISVNDYAVQDVPYDTFVTAKTTFTLQLNLTKDTSSTYFDGQYSGQFKLQSVADTKTYDSTYAQIWCDVMNGEGRNGITAPASGYPKGRLKVMGDNYTESNFDMTLSNDSFSFRIPNKTGIISLPMDLMQLSVVEFNNHMEHNVHLGWTTAFGEKFDYYITMLISETIQTDNFDWYYSVPNQKTVEGHSNETSPVGQDPRPYLNCRIEIIVNK